MSTSQNFNAEVITAAFATKSLLELGGGDNLSFMKFKIDIFKIQIRKIYGSYSVLSWDEIAGIAYNGEKDWSEHAAVKAVVIQL